METTNMDNFQPIGSSARALPAADVMAGNSRENVEYQAFPVRKPEEDLNDFIIKVRASKLASCRSRLLQLAKAPFPWHELLLGLSTMSTGAYFGALPAIIPPDTSLSLLFNTLLPMIGAASFVAYLFLRHTALVNPSKLAFDLLSELPDPDKTR